MCGIRKFRCHTLDALLPSRPNLLEEPDPIAIESIHLEVTPSDVDAPSSSNSSSDGDQDCRETGSRKINHQKITSLTAGGEMRKFVSHNYVDRADLTPDVLGKDADDFFFEITSAKKSKQTKPKGQLTFPFKLHMMLHEVEKTNLTSVVSWLPHGRAFVVHDIERFKTQVMGKYFQQSKITSFNRQLNLYDFVRISAGTDRGAYYHEYFMRGKPHAIKFMSRTKVKGTKIRASSSPEDEPNFYAMNPVNSPPYRGGRAHFMENEVVIDSLQSESTRCSTSGPYSRDVLPSSSNDVMSSPSIVSLCPSSDLGYVPTRVNSCSMNIECKQESQQDHRSQSHCKDTSSFQNDHSIAKDPPFDHQQFSSLMTAKNPIGNDVPKSLNVIQTQFKKEESDSDPVLDKMVSSVDWASMSTHPNTLVRKFENWEADGDSLVGDVDISRDKDFIYSLYEQPNETLMEYTCDVLLKL